MPAFAPSPIATAAAYAATPDVSLDFTPDFWLLRSDAGNYFFSFDGVTDHGLIKAADLYLNVPTKRTKMWLKQSGGAATARVSAFSTS
jgi:hypothetical protein